MSTLATVVDFIGASGFVAGVGAIFGLGRLHQKVENQNKSLEALEADIKETTSSHTAMAITLGRVEERIGNIREDIADIKNSLRSPLG